MMRTAYLGWQSVCDSIEGRGKENIMMFYADIKQKNREGRFRAIIMLGMIGLLMFIGGCGNNLQKESTENQGVQEKSTGKQEMQKEDKENLEEWKEGTNLQQKALQYVVKVQLGASMGSGVLYEKTEEQLVIVTASHVLKQEKGQAQVTFYDGLTVESDSYYISDSSDLAFINVPLASLTNQQIEKYVPACVDKEAFDNLQGGSEVIFQSAMTEEEAFEKVNESSGIVLENWIYVEDFQQYMMLLKGVIYPGMSGGGVFNPEYNLVGIICGANEEGEVAAVPLSIIQAEYAGAY